VAKVRSGSGTKYVFINIDTESTPTDSISCKID
jgi:hypothetical protein